MFFEWIDENGRERLSKICGIKGIITLLIGQWYGIRHIPKKEIIFEKRG